MAKTLLFYNGDWHKQKPLSFKECFDMSSNELLSIFHSGNYRRNTGTFLMTDSLAKNINADYVAPHDFDMLKNYNAKSIVTNAFHCVSPNYVFDKQYWQKILDLNTKLVPLTFGFRYHQDGKFHLTKDMIYIFQQIAERNEIGVRGEYAAEILDNYGIKNVKIIGCHSLFYYMDRNFSIEKKDKKIERLNFNFNQCYTDYYQTHLDFCNTSLRVFDYFYNLFEEGRITIDYTMQTAFMKELINYSNFTSFNNIKKFVMDSGRYYFSVDDWTKALKQDDFSIGTQFHGNVASILAGTPALIISIDKRMEELVKYHKIPFIKVEDFKSDEPLEYYWERCDYSEFNKNYARTFDDFKDYCYRNCVDLK